MLDVKRHIDTKKHADSDKTPKSASIMDFFQSANSSTQEELRRKVTRAEVLVAGFLVEHNIALSAADHATQLFKEAFPDSDIAKQFKCGRTKTTQIVKTLALDAQTTAATHLQKGPFVVGTDGSQEGGDKYFPVVVRYIKDEIITTELLANPTCKESATGENIFDVVSDAMSNLGVPWQNCLSLVCDNANVMTGINKGVIAYVHKQAPNVHLAGCVCHLLNLAVKRGVKAFQLNKGFDFDDILRQLSWYINKSSNRLHRLQAIQETCGLPQHKIIDHCPTRWLALGASLNRLIELWPAVQSFFKEECATDKDKGDEQDTIKTRIKKFMERPSGKLYALFLAFIIEQFDKINKVFQTDKATIHKVKWEMEIFYRKLLSMFLKSSALSSGHHYDVNFSAKYNIKPDTEVMIGSTARKYLKSPGVSKKSEQQFFQDVVYFFQTTCGYLKEKVVKSGEPLWRHAVVADPTQASTSWTSMTFFLERFPSLLPEGTPQDDLEVEFIDFRTYQLPDDIKALNTAEEQWTQISKIKDSNGSLRFPKLPTVMLGILLIPVSNCACERIFSLVRKNKTEFRSSMDKSTVEALMILKSSRGPCYKAQFSDKLLEKCKRATAAATGSASSK